MKGGEIMLCTTLIKIGKRLRQAREQHGLTRERLREAVDRSPRFIYDLELGNKGMSVDTLVALSKLFNIPIDYILFGKCREYTASQLEILSLLGRLPESKLTHPEEIIKIFVASHKEL